MRLPLLLLLVSVPVSADELQFVLTGFANPITNVDVSEPFRASFLLDTLSGPSSFTLGGPEGCVQEFSFSGANASHLNVTVGGKRILNTPHTVAFGGGGAEAYCLMANGMTVGDFHWNEFDTNNVSTSLDPKDPLADFLLHTGYAFNFASFGDWEAGEFSVQVTSVPEPATLSLLALGLAGVGFMRRRKRHCVLPS